MPLTKEKIKAYLANPLICPFCGSDEVEENPELRGFEEIDQHEIMCQKRCKTCDKMWRDYYKLIDIEELDADGCAIPNEEG